MLIPIRAITHSAVRLPHRFAIAWSTRVDVRITTVGCWLASVLGFGLLSAALHIRLGFYELTAQVLPLVMLAVVVEGRYFRGVDSRETTARVILKMMLFVPVFGEAAALACVARGHDDMLSRGGVFCAYFVALALLAVYASDGPATITSRRVEAIQAAACAVRNAYERSQAED